MKINLFRILRSLWKNKTFTLINLFGLSVGMACALLIFVWVNYELSFDNFHKNSDYLYRIINKWPDNEYSLSSPGAAAKVLTNEFPEIINSTLLCELEDMKISGGDLHFFTKIVFVDPSFFEMFSFPFVSGQKNLIYSDPNSVVLSEKMVKKLFGDNDPIGKTVLIDDGEFNLKVSGVIKDIPQNSHIQSDVFICAEIGYLNMHIWENNWPHIYVQLDKNASENVVNQKISGLVQKYRTNATNQLSLERLDRIHLYSRNGGGLIIYIYIFSAVAIIILLIACFNFINLSTAQAIKRFKEFGIRKMIGASRRRIIYQILTETMIVSMLAVVLAAITLEVLRPFFCQFLDLPLVIKYDLKFFVVLVCISTATGLIAGLYPSLYFSSVNPISVIKKSVTLNTGKRLFGIFSQFSVRSTLIVLQYILSISFITITIIILSQLNFINNRDLGYKKDGIIILPFQKNISNITDVIKSELLSNPNINSVTFSFPHPVIQEGNTALVLAEGHDPEDHLGTKFKMIDYDFFETFEIPIINGQTFSKESGTDKDSYVINEVLADLLGFENPVGQQMALVIGGKPFYGAIIGVVKNYNDESLHNGLKPLTFRLRASYNTISIKMNMVNFETTLAFIDKKIRSYAPEFVFDYHFLESDLTAQYRNERKSSNLILMATILAIILSALGLYGLVLFTIHQRKKEIGIRKVNGASIINIFNLLIIRIIKWIFISGFFAIPISYFIIQKWLENFAFRIELKPWMFVLALIISLLISITTVLYHSLKAAFENPVESLKYE